MAEPQFAVGANLCFIESRPLTGPGYYAVQVFENLVAMSDAGDIDFVLSGYVQDKARHHFSDAANSRLQSVGNLEGRVNRVLFEQLRLPFRSRRDRIDILWSPAFVSPLWGAPALVASICDMYYRVVPEVVEPFQRRYWSWMIPLTARVCDLLITISENSKKDMLAYLPVEAPEIVVTPLASRLRGDSFANTAPEVTGDYILLVANTTPNKNCDRVVDAISRLNERGRPIALVHIGNDIEGRLRASANARGVGNLVFSMGKVSDEALANAYRHCMATIVASTYEGFGMPAAEALAMGAPLICSNTSALPEAAGDAALLIDPLDVEAIVGAIERVCTQPDLRAELVRRGSEHSKTMSWRKTAALTAAAFESVLEKRAR